MATRHRARPLLILSMVVGIHLIVVWLLVSPRLLSLKTKAGSLQLVWIPQPLWLKAGPEPQTTTERATNTPRHRADRAPASPPLTPPSIEEGNAIHPAPDWTEELHRAAKHALANELAQKGHELDFAHSFPAPLKKPPQFAWDHTATHRIEAIPEGGLLLHLSENCVFILFPLPFAGCGIGKRPVNGDLFEHMHEK
jgi:hypothetical protein